MSYLQATETLACKAIRSVSRADKEFGADKSLLVARPGKLFGAFPVSYTHLTLPTIYSV